MLVVTGSHYSLTAVLCNYPWGMSYGVLSIYSNSKWTGVSIIKSPMPNGILLGVVKCEEHQNWVLPPSLPWSDPAVISMVFIQTTCDSVCMMPPTIKIFKIIVHALHSSVLIKLKKNNVWMTKSDRISDERIYN